MCSRKTTFSSLLRLWLAKCRRRNLEVHQAGPTWRFFVAASLFQLVNSYTEQPKAVRIGLHVALICVILSWKTFIWICGLVESLFAFISFLWFRRLQADNFASDVEVLTTLRVLKTLVGPLGLPQTSLWILWCAQPHRLIIKLDLEK